MLCMVKPVKPDARLHENHYNQRLEHPIHTPEASQTTVTATIVRRVQATVALLVSPHDTLYNFRQILTINQCVVYCNWRLAPGRERKLPANTSCVQKKANGTERKTHRLHYTNFSNLTVSCTTCSLRAKAHESFRASFRRFHGRFHGFHGSYRSFHANKSASFQGNFRESFHGSSFHERFHASFHGSSESFHGGNFHGSFHESLHGSFHESFHGSNFHESSHARNFHESFHESFYERLPRKLLRKLPWKKLSRMLSWK